MSSYCLELQGRLAERGVELLQGDEFAADHLGDCKECFSCLDALGRLDSCFEEVPEERVEEELVVKTLAAVRSISLEEKPAAASSLILQGLGQIFSAWWIWLCAVSESLVGILGSPGRRMSALGGVFVAALALLVVAQHDELRPTSRMSLPPSKNAVSGGHYGDLVLAFRDEMSSAKDALRDTESSLRRMQSEFREHQERVTDVIEKVVNRSEEQAIEIDALAVAVRSPEETVPMPSRQQQMGPDELDTIGFDDAMLAPEVVGGGGSRAEASTKVSTMPSYKRHDSGSDPFSAYVAGKRLGTGAESDLFVEENAKLKIQLAPFNETARVKELRQVLGKKRESGTAIGRKVVGSANAGEIRVYVTPGEPSQLSFPAKVKGGFKRKFSALSLERSGPNLVVFARPEIPYEGEVIIVRLENEQSFAVRVLPADDDNPRKAILAVDAEAGFDHSQSPAPYELLYPESGIGEQGGGKSEDTTGLVLPLEWDEGISPLEWFRESRALRQDLNFREPRGYWANTYVPGSPTLRDLHSSLLAWDRAPLEKELGRAMALHDAARPVTQPFDAPHDAALALYAHADHRGVQGEERVLVQVGLKGALRRSGRRPAMNVGVVFDLRSQLSTSKMSMLRALLFSLDELRDIGDRFSLTVAGPKGGVVVPAKDFRHGFLNITWDEISEGRYKKGQNLSLSQAVEAAVSDVSLADNPNAPLGSSVVLLVSDKDISGELEELKTLAEKSALGGISLSVIGLAQEDTNASLETLARSGQGKRWNLDRAADAKALLERELAGVSRVVARAVRLNIRLAPEVKLIDVIGSVRLDDNESTQVRRVESSIDQRLARNLGIDADRGEDEDGIQIFIPAYYAGDSHVILLDVVVPGPGAVFEVSARYKDLTQLKNTTSRAQLTLASGVHAAGQLEENVVKNYLALQMGTLLEYAGRKVDAENEKDAAALVKSYLHLLNAFQNSSTSLARDSDLQADIRMLDDYLLLLSSSDETVRGSRKALGDSLEFAARRKKESGVILENY